MTENDENDDPPPTKMDTDCAYFVRDALFPLLKDWGSNNRHHSQIHPALDALDRLRTSLVDRRPTTMSYSNVFPRGVLLVPKSEAVDHSNNHRATTTTAMDYNGQPEVDESNASLEVIPNLLTVQCLNCSSITTDGGKAFVRTQTNKYTHETQHQIVVCSDRVLQTDYTSDTNIGSGRREDLPVKSLQIVEETLARELTKLRVHRETNDDEVLDYPTPTTTPCEAYASLEVMAARASECLLLQNTDGGELRKGSALKPHAVFGWLPGSVQNRFIDRCVRSVALQHLKDAPLPPDTTPKECLAQAWAAAAADPSR